MRTFGIPASRRNRYASVSPRVSPSQADPRHALSGRADALSLSDYLRQESMKEELERATQDKLRLSTQLVVLTSQ